MVNKIFWQEDKIGLITNHLEAETHNHWMLQLFIGIDDRVEITIGEKMIKCFCIIVDKNVSHSFSAKKKVYYSAIIEPTSDYAGQLTSKMNDLGYWVCDKEGIDDLRQLGKALVGHSDLHHYLEFVKSLNDFLAINTTPKSYDDRIIQLLQLLETCDSDTHTISNFAEKVFLSPSRLSHLFKEQIGVPLKSYLVLHQMERAFKELLEGKTATEAAMIAGFSTPSHFSGTVKKMMGMPLSLYLKDSEFLKVY